MSTKPLEKVSVIPADEPSALVTVTPMDMLNRALTSGASMEVLEKFMALSERWEANQARKSFDAAMSAAKAEIPVIAKNRQVGFDSKKVGASRTDYRHEDLAEIARTVDPILSKYGLSYRFRATSNVNEPITVTCVISHREGHAEETTLRAGRDDSGNKNPIQQIGSTITYLQRYTLKAALGLAASSDDDGKASSAPDAAYEPPPGSITQAQADTIVDALEDKGASRGAFLNWVRQTHPKVQRLEGIPAEYLEACMAAIAKFKKA